MALSETSMSEQEVLDSTGTRTLDDLLFLRKKEGDRVLIVQEEQELYKG